MEHLITFENYNYYNEDIIVEKLDLQPLLDKFKSSTNKKIIAISLLGALLSVMSIAQTHSFIEKSSKLRAEEKKALIHELNRFKDPLKIILSQKGWDHIKEHEKLKLVAYYTGDGRITIGYGHSENQFKSKWRVGDKITEKEAFDLLVQDVNDAADGVRRMFAQWKEDGIDIKITQNQFDVMVSLTFNMGIGGFRQSEFVRVLKKHGVQKAAPLIKTIGLTATHSYKDEEGNIISSKPKKMGGLVDRRMKEYKIFIS